MINPTLNHRLENHLPDIHNVKTIFNQSSY